MRDALLLDTHSPLWLDSGDERLRRHTRDLIDRRWSAGGTIYLSPVSAWEIALLINAGRMDLGMAASDGVRRFLGRPGLASAPLTCLAAASSYQLDPLEHRDPADRLLIATAIDLACPLITYDARILDFAQAHGREYAFMIA